MKIRAGLIATIVLMLGGCSSGRIPFESWVKSKSALNRMQALSADPSFEDVNERLVASVKAVVGDGSLLPLPALEKYFEAIPADQLVGSENTDGLVARRFFRYVTAGQNVKIDNSYDRELTNLWATQLFRTLPIDERLDLLTRPSFSAYRDPAEPGRLVSFQQNRKPGTAEKFAAELSRVFPPTSKPMMRFQDAIRPLPAL